MFDKQRLTAKCKLEMLYIGISSTQKIESTMQSQ